MNIISEYSDKKNERMNLQHPERDLSMSSLQRGLLILTTITDHGEISVPSLVRQLDLPRSTIYRHLQVLARFHLIEEDGGLYTPGWRAIGMSGRNLTHSLLSDFSVETLSNISDALQETALITVRAGTHAVCLRQIRGLGSEQRSFKINQVLPLYAGAGQRLLLSYAPKTLFSTILTHNFSGDEEQKTEAERIQQEAELARQNRYLISRSELQDEAFALAVPVFFRDEVICALTVAGPQAKCDNPEWIVRALRILRLNAKSLSDRLVAADDAAETNLL